MFKKNRVGAAVALAFGGAASIIAPSSIAQTAPETAQRIEVTGSAIRRIEAEGALPVLVIKKEDIQRSGATNTVDLIRQLPAIQGSTGESASVGGSTFGFSGASIHDIGETRTLVLLNGHRLTTFGGQTLTGFAAGFDLNSLPISAIERIEVLSDGASALYGADAIAGVINFITKRDSTYGDISLGVSQPKSGAKEERVSLTKGFGSLDSDGWNAVLAFSHDKRTKLNSTDRDFAKSGRILFSNNGKNYRIQQASASPIPANVSDDAGNLVNPYLINNGTCPDKTFRITDGGDDYCGFNFVGELEIYPERSRDSGFASLTAKVGGQELFADLLISQTKQTSRIAPVPGSISIPAGSPLYTQYLTPLGGFTQDTVAFYRLYDLGKRTSNDTADFQDIVIGARGTLFNWDYTANINHSESKAKSSISGYPGALALRALRRSGLLDPFVLAGQQTAAAQAAINATNYNGYWDGGKATLDSLNLRGSSEVLTLPAGAVSLAAGISINTEKFQKTPSLFAQGLLADPVAGTPCVAAGGTAPCDQRFGDAATTTPYSAKRNSWGAFTEVAIPVLKNLETSLSLRHDHYADFGNADTAKATVRWKADTNLLFRASIGNGFHAPTVPQVSAPLQPYGVTSGKYSCTTTPDLRTVATNLGAVCRPGSAQYDQLAGGNVSLAPEKSNQATIGIRVEPVSWVSVGADLWHVDIKNTFGQLPEQSVFANPLAYPGSWGTNTDVGTGANYLAFKAINQNQGKQFSTGLDLDFSAHGTTPIGDLKSQLTLTYMIREVAQQVVGGTYYSSVGDFGGDVGGVTFRYQGRFVTSLKTGAFTNTLAVNFKSGYKDQEQTVDVLDAAGNVTGSEAVRLDVKTYSTLDWQTQYDVTSSLNLSVGVLNLFNTKPPLSLSTSGTNKGQQFGYDDRYYDPRLRTIYGNLTYKF
jgi:iron complex outermembrane receptor protein